MRKLLLVVFLLSSVFSFAQQQSPVSWTFSSKKVGDNVYELHLVANIQSGWHLYSQSQPADAIAQPTSFSFTKNPLLSFDGTVKEIGKLEKFRDAKLEVSANQYSHKVVFVQKVKVKGKVKTSAVGKLEFQTCDDKKCLPPKTVNFNIALS